MARLAISLHSWKFILNGSVYQVLFVCSHNSARSIMAEGFMNSLGAGRFKAWSAGSHPTGEVSPFAISTLAKWGVQTEGYRSKNWMEFTGPEAPQFDFIITVCDIAAGEPCPVWPGKPLTAHWGVSDPMAFEGSDEQKTMLFWDISLIIRRRIELMTSLPVDSLSRVALVGEMESIGIR
jgi:arsenate reductase